MSTAFLSYPKRIAYNAALISVSMLVAITVAGCSLEDTSGQQLKAEQQRSLDELCPSIKSKGLTHRYKYDVNSGLCLFFGFEVNTKSVSKPSKQTEEALGPFPKAMQQGCQQIGGGSACTKDEATATWSLKLAQRLRGADFCPVGTKETVEGWCVETVDGQQIAYTPKLSARLGGQSPTAMLKHCDAMAQEVNGKVYNPCLPGAWRLPLPAGVKVGAEGRWKLPNIAPEDGEQVGQLPGDQGYFAGCAQNAGLTVKTELTIGGREQEVTYSLPRNDSKYLLNGVFYNEDFAPEVEVGNCRWLSGKISHFGGPGDPHTPPSKKTALTLERSGNLNIHNDRYAALRLPYFPMGMPIPSRTSPDYWSTVDHAKFTLWKNRKILVCSQETNKCTLARLNDWGPNENTKRLVDVSQAVLRDLGIKTDDTVLVSLAR